MKIKFQIPRGLRPGKKKTSAYHYWLLDEQPRKMSKLAQLNKANTRKRTQRGLYRGPQPLREVLR